MRTIKTLFVALGLCLCAIYSHAQNAAVDNITKNYYSLKDALAAGKGADAQADAKQLLASLSADPAKDMNADQQKTMDAYLEKLKFDARHISESKDIEHQREHFASLSKNMFETLKALKMNKENIYVDYCPMKKAYWLSDKTAIKNPYYSDMATCGKVATTLPAVK